MGTPIDNVTRAISDQTTLLYRNLEKMNQNLENINSNMQATNQLLAKVVGFQQFNVYHVSMNRAYSRFRLSKDYPNETDNIDKFERET